MTKMHAKLVDALSPSSGLYGVLWPAIIAQAPFILRRLTLYNVNRYFRDLCSVYHNSEEINGSGGDSDVAKLVSYIRIYPSRSRRDLQCHQDVYSHAFLDSSVPMSSHLALYTVRNPNFKSCV